MRYIIIGGSGYFRNYTGTGVYTSLKIYGKTDSENQIKHIVDEFWGDSGGLMFVLDTETGEGYTGEGT